jgi:hypothetical protein
LGWSMVVESRRRSCLMWTGGVLQGAAEHVVHGTNHTFTATPGISTSSLSF